MGKRHRWALLVALLLAFVSPRAVRAIGAEYPVGVRALGMGNASVASPGRASAVSLNAGAIASLGEYAAEAFTADLFGLIRTNYIAGVLPFSERHAVGFDWHRVQARDSELDFSQNRFRAAYSFRVRKRLSFGAGLSYRTQRASLDETVLGGAAGWSTDLGMIWKLPGVDGLTFGGSIRNWLSSTSGGRWRSGAWLRVEDGASQRVVPRVTVWGFSYRRSGLTAMFEWNEGVRIGIERRFGSRIALRAGINDPSHAGEGPTYTVGASGRARWGRLDYALVIPPELPPTSYFGITFAANYRVPPVVIEGVAMRDPYVALRDYYARPQGRRTLRTYTSPDEFRQETTERIGEVWLYNPGKEAVRVSVRLWIDRYTSKRGTEAVEGVEIAPGARRIVPLQKFLLSDEAMRLRENRPAEVRVEVSDVRNPSRRRALATTSILLHGRNAIRLDDLGKLAVFISPTDPTVREFATRTLESLRGDLSSMVGPPNLVKAMALFGALREVGYGNDPNLPRESGTIDAIKYPNELLDAIRRGASKRPIGDCDDSTVLVASLFEAVGISTALIQTPKHVLLAFDLNGVSLERAQESHADAYTIGIDGDAWIPLETTLLSKGFPTAWRVGLEQVRGGIVNSVTTRNAWEQYGSASVEFPFRAIEIPTAELRRRLAEDRDDPWFREAIAPFEDGAGKRGAGR